MAKNTNYPCAACNLCFKQIAPLTPKNQNIMTITTYCNKLSWMTKRAHNEEEMILKGCYGVWGIIFPSVMVKASDLNDFVRGQNSIARYSKRVFSKLHVSRVVCDIPLLVLIQSYKSPPPPPKAKTTPLADSTDISIYCRSKWNFFVTHRSANTVECETAQQMSHSRAFVDQASSSNIPTLGRGASWLDYGI